MTSSQSQDSWKAFLPLVDDGNHSMSRHNYELIFLFRFRIIKKQVIIVQTSSLQYNCHMYNYNIFLLYRPSRCETACFHFECCAAWVKLLWLSNPSIPNVMVSFVWLDNNFNIDIPVYNTHYNLFIILYLNPDIIVQ